MHAANLAAAIKRTDKQIHIAALGGSRLKAIADDFIYDLTSLSAFGFWQPIKQYFFLKNLLREKVLSQWDSNPPDKVILVDYYGLNIYLAEQASRRRIPVYYFVSPQVWASRKGRIKKLAKYVKKMLVVLPFEEELYRKAGVDAVFVGHPLLDMVPANSNNQVSDNTPPVIGLFPGSRRNVVVKHLPILEAAAVRIMAQIPCKFRIFAPPNIADEFKSANYRMVTENGYEERSKLSLAITTSGTVSLENALLGLPMIVMYKLSRFNYWVAKILVKIKYITMANILLEKPVVPELIQNDATPEKIAEAAVKLLTDRAAYALMKQELLSIRKVLGNPGVSDRAANIILNDR